MHLTEGITCVDDLKSPAYNTISSRAKIGWKVHGENMWRVQEYARGLLVDYPTNAKARAGSCIFIHVRLPEKTGTAGCVALPSSASKPCRILRKQARCWPFYRNRRLTASRVACPLIDRALRV